MAPDVYNPYPPQNYPPPVPQYFPRVTTQASTTVTHTQPHSSGKLCTSTSSKTLYLALYHEGLRFLGGSAFSWGVSYSPCIVTDCALAVEPVFSVLSVAGQSRGTSLTSLWQGETFLSSWLLVQHHCVLAQLSWSFQTQFLILASWLNGCVVLNQ